MKTVVELVKIGDIMAAELETSWDVSVHEQGCRFLRDPQDNCDCRVMRIKKVIERWQEATT